jgi:TfoX/Sxy family transcriptional regulator of competence genes
MLERVRAALAGVDGVAERRMVGGRSFLVNGHMSCGVVGDELMVRLAPADYERALREPLVRPMTLGGRRLKRCLLIGTSATATDEQLSAWVARALASATGSAPEAR